jgi:predicted transcriptional regulator
MEHKRLCESDYRFMCVIWDNEPLSSTRLVQLCAEELGWKKSTTYTMLKKMCEKDFVLNENATVTALMPRDAVQAHESTSSSARPLAAPSPLFGAFLVTDDL